MRKKDSHKLISRVWNCKWLYMMLIPVILYYIVFKYVPMYGVTMAFQDYNVYKGMSGSPWVVFLCIYFIKSVSAEKSVHIIVL